VCFSDERERTIVVGGKEADAFLTQQAAFNPVCTEIICTTDVCTNSLGCENINLKCSVPLTSCNASLGCFEEGNVYEFTAGECISVVVQSLIDFCGVCYGDSVSCFFNSIDNVPLITGISAGVAVGIAVAAVAAALIAFYASKKGYDYYRAQSDNAAAGLHQNPYYVDNSNAGEMPTTARGAFA
jgi:hypothetical protein